jgi:hypothetical protein
LKITKGYSETINRGRTDTTMAKRQMTKRQEQFEDNKGVIRNCKSKKKDRKYNDKKRTKCIKGMIHKTLHRKFSIEEHEPNINSGVHTGALKDVLFNCYSTNIDLAYKVFLPIK